MNQRIAAKQPLEPRADNAESPVGAEASSEDLQPTKLRSTATAGIARTALHAALAKAGFKGMQEPVLAARTVLDMLAATGIATVPYVSDVMVKESLEEVARKYANWALGLGEFANLRESRLACGLDPGIKAEDLFPKEVNVIPSIRQPRGRAFELRSRREDESWLMVLQHSVGMGKLVSGVSAVAPPNTESIWGHHIRLDAQSESETRVRHAIRTLTPPDSRLKPVSGPPDIILSLLRSGRASGWSHGNQLAVLRQTLDDTTSFVKETLLSPARRNPILVITSRKGEDDVWKHPVSGRMMATALSGMANVIEIEAPERLSQDAFLRAMANAGAPRDLNVLDGGARLYMPGMKISDDRDDHRLWSHYFFDRMPEHLAVGTLLSEIALQVSDRAISPGFLSGIENLDRKRRLALHEATLERVRTETGMPVSASAEQAASPDVGSPVEDAVAPPVAAGEERIGAVAELAAQLEVLQEENRLFCDENERLENEVRHYRIRLATLQSEREDLEFQIERSRSRGKGAHAEDQDREALNEAIVMGNPTLEQALRFLQATFPNRIEVLPSALKAAKEAEGFKYREKAWELQRKLATEYWSAMANGDGGDAKARGVFGAAYSAKEAELASNSERGARLRTFSYHGEPVMMVRHLRIGVKVDSLAETWRLHFHWDGDKKKIVIGHSGRHLDFN